jgi:hypothetical protein
MSPAPISVVMSQIVIFFNSPLSETSAMSNISEVVGLGFEGMSVGKIRLGIGKNGYDHIVVKILVSVIHIIVSQ